jgi:iron-sulfur cluster assembly protein
MTVTNTTSGTPKLVQATPEAVAELKRLITQESDAVEGVRLAVRGGGCSGLSYSLDFDAPREGDNVVEIDGMRFFLDRKSTIYLKGIVLDYKEGLKGKGFVFTNPNATSTCGCGESFSV